MELWLEILIWIIGLLAGSGALFAGIGYFKQGRNDGKLDTIALFKEQVEALTKKVTTQEETMKKLGEEVRLLHQAIDERDKKFAEAILSIQGRDPAMQAFMKMMETYISTNTPMLETIKTEALPTIKRLEKYLNHQQF